MQNFKNKDTFLTYIEDIMEEYDVGVMDAAMLIHEKNGVEMESIASYMRRIPELKDRLYDEAKIRRMVL